MVEDAGLANRIAEVKALLAQGPKENAQQAARGLVEYPTQSLDQAQLISKLLIEVGLRGPAEIAVLRYIDAHPEDRLARLVYLQMRAKSQFGTQINKLDAFLGGFVPETLEEHLKLARVLTDCWLNQPAFEMSCLGVKKFPGSQELLFCFIENLNRQKDYRGALREIITVIKLMPYDAGCAAWSFLAEQSAIAGGEDIFRMTAAKAEPMLTESDLLSRFRLARGYDRYQDKASVERVLNGVRIDLIRLSDEWILIKMLEFSERYWLTKLQLGFARRCLALKIGDVALRRKCENLVNRLGAIPEIDLTRKTLFL